MPTPRFARRLALICAAAVLACLVSGAAEAGGPYHERIYADSFGNLVVYSPSGYKRIVVGRGYLAERMRASRASEGPKVVHLDRGSHAVVPCHRHAVLLYGRSYMYGLPDGVVPEPSAAACW